MHKISDIKLSSEKSSKFGENTTNSVLSIMTHYISYNNNGNKYFSKINYKVTVSF